MVLKKKDLYTQPFLCIYISLVNTMKIKIIDKLKKKLHKDIALVQDVVVDTIYEIFPRAVLHGGTAIWRCYQGARFSEDIDIYLNKTELKRVDEFKKKLIQKNLNIIKFKKTDNVIYAKISFIGVEIRFEASFFKKQEKIIIKPYETIDGNYINVFTLSAEDLIKEKVNTYLSRQFIRDLYDIYVLLNYAEIKKIKNDLKRLLLKYKKPKDETILQSLIFIGAIPTTQQILIQIKKWAK